MGSELFFSIKGVKIDLTPFIAHVNGDHYVLVTRISEDKVYFSEEHKEEFLPKEKFLKEVKLEYL